MKELMEIGKVQDELKKILEHFESMTAEEGDGYDRAADAIMSALEYLWMYEDLGQ